MAYHSALFTMRFVSFIAYTCITTVTSGMQVGVVGSLLCVQTRNACGTDLLIQTHERWIEDLERTFDKVHVFLGVFIPPRDVIT